MARIEPNQNPTPEAQEKLNAIEAKLGMVPNIFATFSHSPAVLDFYMQGSGALGNTSISAELRESLALTVAGINSCDYCASAHTAIGAGAGMETGELTSNLSGASADTKTQAALNFATTLVKNQGNVNDNDVQTHQLL